MSKKRSALSLSKAKRYADFLLYEITGGNLGVKPENLITNSTATFAEKRGLLDSLVKIASLEQKDTDDGPEVSGMDLIRKQMAKDKENGSGTVRGRRDTRGTAEDSPDDLDSDHSSSNTAEDDTADRG